MVERKRRPSFNQENKASVVKSLRRFTERMNDGVLTGVILPYRREGIILAEGKPVIVPYWGQFESIAHANFDTDGSQGSFEMDNHYGFGLGYQIEGDDQPVWFGVTAFSTEYNNPCINQLQGMSQRST